MKDTIQNYLNKIGITALNNMQFTALKTMQQHPHVMLLSPTGSGKTLAYLLPLLLKLKDIEHKGVKAIIIVPSRELALQIEQVFKSLQTGLKVTCCYGGHYVKTEENSLINEAPTVIAATPGRLAYHIREGNFDVSSVRYLILDEFDKSLELGFEEDMAFIAGELFKVDSVTLTSATSMDELPQFISQHDYELVDFLDRYEHQPDITVQIVKSQAKDKLKSLLQLLCLYPNEPAIIFCNFREAVEHIDELLWQNNIVSEIYHGGLNQPDREKALLKFRNGTTSVLVTTDLGSRGLDIPQVKHVIHYQIPLNEEAFIHRNGRTGRMKADGNVHLLLTNEEYKPEYIENYTETNFEDKNIALPNPTNWVTFYVSAGKKDKINKIDIAGLFYKKAELSKDDLGLIDVQDKMSYVAVNRHKAKKVEKLLRDEKIKGKKYRIGIDE